MQDREFLPLQHGLEWSQEVFDVVPRWTIEPDISAVESLAKRHMPPGVEYRASFFAAGAFNKLFLISSINEVTPSSCCIMRVTLPVDPYFKTASEVATLKYLAQHTSIPVPHVIDYDTSPYNELGFEWILMTRLPGVCLKDLWSCPQLLWEEKVHIVETVSGYIQQMQINRFDKMGNLYLSRVHSGGETFIPLANDPQFSIGPVVAIPFFYGNRIKLPSDRGPFATSAEWISSLLKLQIASTTHLMANPPKDCNVDDGYDSDDISEFNGIIKVSSDLLSLVPEFFLDTDREEFVLYHNDLSTNNILIDPITHHVTGVVDWECISLQPTWNARQPPQLLHGPEINAEFYERNFGLPISDLPPQRNINSAETETMLSELQDYLEKMLLRRVFDSIIHPDGRPEKLKRIFENKVAQLDVRWGRVARWVKDLRNGKDPERKGTEEDGLYFWPEN
jgi:hypothetical protein